MLTYNLENVEGPMYEYIYNCIKEDIVSGKLSVNEKLPSKRSFANNNGVSTITIQNAYEQLAGEGYIYTLPKKGYYVADVSEYYPVGTEKKEKSNIVIPEKSETLFDFSSNSMERDNFPFSVWAKLTRDCINNNKNALLEVSPCAGVYELREAIANHLSSFRGMWVDPMQIVVGAGTEYLYSLLVKLLGVDKKYCIENPGYKKIKQIYESNGAVCITAKMDEKGILVEELRKKGADIAHISPTHHFPTGITMPVSRRHELLNWAAEKDGRYIIEDDYDSEFRIKGKPVSPLQSIDREGKTIYMNTFSKSLTSTIRISYMVLPEELVGRFYRDLSFYSCTVSTFEQYTLANFIARGYFEKHINRMRLHYGRKRAEVLEIIRLVFDENQCNIMENDSGLHFILQLKTGVSDENIKKLLTEKGIKIHTISDYGFDDEQAENHRFILNYSGIDLSGLENALKVLKNIAKC